MKYYLALGLLFVAAAAVGGPLGTPKLILPNNGLKQQLKNLKTEGNANEFVDRLLENLGPFLVDHGLDPFPLMDIELEFGFFFIIEYNGHLYLQNGWLQDLATVYRSGDATLGYQNHMISVAFDVEFKDLIVNFDYEAKFIGIGPSGIFKARVTEQQLRMELLIDTQLSNIYLQKFELINNGKIDIDLTGLGDFGSDLVAVFMEAITIIFKDEIMVIIADQLRDAINHMLDNFNNRPLIF